MGKIAQVVAFVLVLFLGYVAATAIYVFATVGLPPALSNFTQDRRLLLLVSVFTLVVFPLVFGPVRKWDRWYVPAIGCGVLGAFHYGVFSLGLIRDPMIQQAIVAQFGFWFFAGSLAYLAAKVCLGKLSGPK